MLSVLTWVGVAEAAFCTAAADDADEPPLDAAPPTETLCCSTACEDGAACAELCPTGVVCTERSLMPDWAGVVLVPVRCWSLWLELDGWDGPPRNKKNAVTAIPMANSRITPVMLHIKRREWAACSTVSVAVLRSRVSVMLLFPFSPFIIRAWCEFPNVFSACYAFPRRRWSLYHLANSCPTLSSEGIVGWPASRSSARVLPCSGTSTIWSMLALPLPRGSVVMVPQ